MKKNMLTRILVGVMTMVSLSSCTMKLQTSTIGVMVDVTENCDDISADEIAGKIFHVKKNGYDDRIGDGMQIYISIIDDQSLGAVNSTLPLSEASFWLRNELQRKEDIKIF